MLSGNRETCLLLE